MEIDIPSNTHQNAVYNSRKQARRKIQSNSGMGSFLLVDRFLHHQCDVDHWARLTEEQQDRRTAKFLKDKGKPHPNATVSSDGGRIIQVPALAGKNKGQGKRPRAD